MKKLLPLFIIIVTISCQKTGNDNKTVPLSPTNLKAVLASLNAAKLTWTDNSTNEDSFRIERKTRGGNYAALTNVKADITTYTDSGLALNTKYVYRVYAFNTAGKSVTYTNEDSVTTNGLPTVQTTTVSNITTTKAVSGGTITSTGGQTVISKGCCWDINHNPTIALSTRTTDTGTTTFLSYISGLTKGTLYYVRAYVTTNYGTYYGDELSFTTTQATLPVFDDTTIYYSQSSNVKWNPYHVDLYVDTTYAEFDLFSMKSDGGSPLTARGVVWSTNHNPTVDLTTKISVGTSLGWITNIIVYPLSQSKTTYYFREYATNSVGTVYSDEFSITTSATQQNVAIGDYWKGGLVYYILQQGDLGYNPSVRHGLIAGVEDWLHYSSTTKYSWNNGTNILVNVFDTAVGYGRANTVKIVNALGIGTYAASHCLNSTLNGYNDWYLPSVVELKLMYQNIGNGASGANHNIGQFGGLYNNGSPIYYWWSSNESDNLNPWAYSINLTDGTLYFNTEKSNQYLVCPVRSF